jgi:hypothetical protein
MDFGSYPGKHRDIGRVLRNIGRVLRNIGRVLI